MTHRRSRGVEPGGWEWALAVDVRRALAELSEGDRRLLLARYWADMTQREVADLLGMPDGTAKVRLHRLRARLRPTLREE